MDNKTPTDQECCAKFDPTPWDGKTLEWSDKRFVKDKVFTLFYMPLNFGKVITGMMAKLDKVGAKSTDSLCLSEHTSKWNMNLYLAVDKEVAGLENTKLSGKFYSKVYEGSFQDTGKWSAHFENQVKEMGMNIEKQYMWYTTCPKCAKKWGKNYVVFIGKIK